MSIISDSHLRWANKKILAVDACFKLSMKGGAKNRSNKDPEFTSGHGVFVDEAHYKEFLQKNAKVAAVSDVLGQRVRKLILSIQEPVPSCGTQFHTVNDAKSRAAATTNITGRHITGVAGIKCARHAFVERVGDLQKGERYVDQSLPFTSLMYYKAI
jgi:hypothetical protein